MCGEGDKDKEQVASSFNPRQKLLGRVTKSQNLLTLVSSRGLSNDYLTYFRIIVIPSFCSEQGIVFASEQEAERGLKGRRHNMIFFSFFPF